MQAFVGSQRTTTKHLNSGHDGQYGGLFVAVITLGWITVPSEKVQGQLFKFEQPPVQAGQ